MTTETLRSVIRDGVTLRYADSGAGDPPIVFIHGWCCDHSYWRDQAPHFAKNHRTVAVDLRGHGQSDKPDQDYSIPEFVGDVAGLIRELGVEHPVVIGHSMGGTIALNLARKYPEITRAIVMVDSPIVPLPETMQPLVEQVMAGLQSPAYQSVAEGFVRMTMFDARSPATLVDEVTAGMSAAPQRVMFTAIVSTVAPESLAPGPIPVPALFIRASTAFASEDQFRERYPGIEVRTVDCAHFVQMEKPEETNALIDSFLDHLA